MSREPRPRSAKGPSPQLLSSPHEDKLLHMIMTLATEVAVSRERIDMLETACRKAGIDLDSVIDDASDVTRSTRSERHRELAERLLQILQDDV